MGTLPFTDRTPLNEAMGPITKAELEMLREQRDTPMLQLELTIGGETEQLVHEIEQNNRAQREAYIEHRLQTLEGRAESDFTLARLEGTAKQDFDRSR